MAEDEAEISRQEKLLAARKRFEELKKEKAGSKKKGKKKGKTLDLERPDQETEQTEQEEARQGIIKQVEAKLPPDDESDPLREHIAEAQREQIEETKQAPKPTTDESENEILARRVEELEMENIALKDSLSAAQTQIESDTETISHLTSEVKSTSLPITSTSSGAGTSTNTNTGDEEYYRNLQEKFSREAQERYLLERDYVSLAKTHEKLVSLHKTTVEQFNLLKKQFSLAQKKLQQETGITVEDSTVIPELATAATSTIDEKALLVAKNANLNTRIQAGTSSFLKTAQGLSAAVVKGVASSANAVIADAAKVGSPARFKNSSVRALSYSKADVYDMEGEDDEDDENGVSQDSGLDSIGGKKQRQVDIETARAKSEWIKTEMSKWTGYMIDLEKAGGSAAGVGPIFVV
ncbi:uncharacterized protein V1516DRAFT_622426 [Lipomyces oligophaga]|uniref:uncharacterized protein n=1 Tax=Lipomyces oligophaga TaxID=45792 RepID=UPI0034CF18DA